MRYSQNDCLMFRNVFDKILRIVDCFKHLPVCIIKIKLVYSQQEGDPFEVFFCLTSPAMKEKEK